MSYIGNEPIVSATRTITEITATAGQTVFVANGGYTVGYIDVFLNGAQLQTVDFTATDGSSITLTEAAQVGDVLKLVAWGTFQTSSALTANNPSYTGTLTGGTGVVNIGSGQVYKDASGNVGINTSSPTQALDVNGNILGAASITIGTSGLYQAGSIYSDSNWGMIFRAKQASPVAADFMWANSAGTERMRIDSSGNVGIGTSALIAGVRFQVKGAGATNATNSIVCTNSAGTIQFFLRDDNFFNSSAIANYSVAGTALVIDANNFVGKTTSSLRYKKDIVDYDKGLDAIAKLRPVYYKSAVEGPNGIDPKTHAGFIAEEIANEGFEEFLIRNQKGEPDAIQYAQLTAVLCKAIQEQQAIITDLKSRIETLESK